MRKLEVVAAVVITILTIIILNACSGNFEAPPVEEELNVEGVLE